MPKVNLTNDEVIILHHLMTTEMSKSSSDAQIPECTWEDACPSCNLMDKLYELWKDTDGKLPRGK